MFYQISEHPNYEISKDGIIRITKNLHIKSQYISSTGYYMVTLTCGLRKQKPRRVHRLLAQTFIPNPGNLPEINHKDGNKLNNKLNNLEWSTHLDNVRHAFRLGLVNNTGQNNASNKLTPFEVKKIKKMLLDGVSQQKIADKIGKVSRSTILKIHLGITWKHVQA